MGDETKLQKAFIKDSNSVLPRSVYLDHEFRLLKAQDVLSREMYEEFGSIGHKKRMCIGRIDLIFRYKSTNYAAEIKYQKGCASDFWDALKIIGYTEYYRWQTDDSDIKPAIIIPLNKIKLEHQIIAGRSGIALFGVNKKSGEYTMKKISDEPLWRQLK